MKTPTKTRVAVFLALTALTKSIALAQLIVNGNFASRSRATGQAVDGPRPTSTAVVGGSATEATQAETSFSMIQEIQQLTRQLVS